MRKISFLILIFFILAQSYFFHIKKGKAEEFLPTSVEVLVTCGDGYAEGLEVCDPGLPPDIPSDIGSTTCQDYNDIYGSPFVSGQMFCRADCSDYLISECYTCGNGHKEDAEGCDGSDFGGQSCISLGFDSGSLLCTGLCLVSTTNCEAKQNEGGNSGAGATGGSSGGSSGAPVGYNPGVESQLETKVIIRGKSYPNSEVHILIDGKVIGIAESDNKADFYFETSDISPGVSTFGFWAEDKFGLKSTLLTITFRVTSEATTVISGVYISPSISSDKKSVEKGETIRIYGQTIPQTDVNVHINSETEHVSKISSKEGGEWELMFNTEPLEEDFHTAKASFEVESEGNIIESGFSNSISFYVGVGEGGTPCPGADLNNDNRVNITDFSILLYYWDTDNSCSDQNQDGTVNLIDFSIMMFNWTG